MFAAYSSNTERAARAYLARKAAEERALAIEAQPASPEPELVESEPAIEPEQSFEDLAHEAVRQFEETKTVSADLQDRHIPVKAIVAAVCAGTDVTPAEVFAEGRSHRILKVRHTAICIAALARPKKSLLWLGHMFQRDHSSILNCLIKHGIERDLSHRPKKLTKADVEQIHKLRNQGMGRERIAATIGISTTKLEYVLSGDRKRSAKSRVSELFELGKNTYEIAKIMGLSEPQVSARLHAARRLSMKNQSKHTA